MPMNAREPWYGSICDPSGPDKNDIQLCFFQLKKITVVITYLILTMAKFIWSGPIKTPCLK
jgi:hypothetical protein